MSLFDEIQRDDLGPALYAEPKSVYLNRSARPGAQKIRELLALWFSHYPEQDQLDLYGRFRSHDDAQYLSAFFELFLHELLLTLENRVEVHPVLQGNPRRPDFLVRPQVGSSYYVEAVVATDETREESAARARMNAVYDVINRMDSPNFFIGMKVRGMPDTPPPGRQIRTFLQHQLADLDPDALGRAFEVGGFQALPHWPYHSEDWHVEFFPIPKSQGLRGRPGVRPIGIELGGLQRLDNRVAIRDAIVEKAGRYGELDLPYVVAVDALADFVDRIDIMEALFGKERFIFRGGQDGADGPEAAPRTPDGAWTSPNGPRYTRVSAVLMAIRLYPSSIPWSSICLYHNPWAARPYEGQINRLPRAAAASEDRMAWHDGISLGQLFQLAADWPGE